MFMVNPGKTKVVFLWHMHQPDYRDIVTGEYYFIDGYGRPCVRQGTSGSRERPVRVRVAVAALHLRRNEPLEWMEIAAATAVCRDH